METFQTHIAGYFRKNSRSDWMNRWLVQKMLQRPVCLGALLKYGSYCIFSVKIIAVTMPPKNPINNFIYLQVYSHIYVFIFGINRRSTVFTISLFKSANLVMIFFLQLDPHLVQIVVQSQTFVFERDFGRDIFPTLCDLRILRRLGGGLVASEYFLKANFHTINLKNYL